MLLVFFLPGLACAGDAAQSGTFDSADVPIAYSVAGTGEPVVLIHGLYSSADINWQKPGTVKLLAERYQVVAFDLRGHGSSGKPTEDDAYGLAMVEDVTRLLDHLHIKKAHIVGYSLGGMIALKFVTLHSNRVLSGTLCGMGWLREGSPLADFREKLPNREGGKTPSACLRGISKLGVTEEALQAVAVPMAVLVGDRDPCRILYVVPLTRVRKDWPVTEIQGAGHLNCIMKEQFKEELKKWLDKNAAPVHG
jgi:pimeloyl-ACP methyl ester carboxylesterase